MSRVVADWMLVGTLLVSGSSGMVLCIDDGGHVAVEPAHQEPCGRTSDAAGRTDGEAASSVTKPSANGTGGCVDMSLVLENVSHVEKDVRQDRLLKNRIAKDVSADYGVLTYAEGQRVQRLACGATPRLSQSLLEQRTVVLLI